MNKPSNFALALINEASLLVGGVVEHAPNRSEFIDASNRFTKAPMGSPYCLSAILFLADKVARAQGVNLECAISGSCVVFYRGSVSNQMPEPEVGGLIIWQHKEEPAKGHAGLIEGVLENGMLKTIEFNTSSAGSGVNREGDGCFRKVRSPHGTSKMRVLGFVRLVSGGPR